MAEEYTEKELRDWVIEKALQAKTPDRSRRVISSYDMRGRATAMVGKLYFFKYEAKGKNVLPKYDRFPLAFALKRYGNGFLGINLHYLGGGERQALVTELLDYANNEYMDQRTKLLISYDILSKVNKIRPLTEPCYKRYLFTHCQSKFIEIYPNEYDKAIKLPVEHWYYKK